eukprot:SAG22_NODE_1755_length_3653_cov_20.353967_6_plen_183_part_00
MSDYGYGEEIDDQSEQGGDGRIMGVVIGGYLVCMGCCSICCITGVLVMLVSGYLCLSHADGSDCGPDGYPGGGVTRLVLGAIPPISALLLLLYLRGDLYGWWRPNYVAPGPLNQPASLPRPPAPPAHLPAYCLPVQLPRSCADGRAFGGLSKNSILFSGVTGEHRYQEALLKSEAAAAARQS